MTTGERAEFALLSDPGRRRAWLSGRWAAKQLLLGARRAGTATEIEILSRDAEGRGSRPRVSIAGQPVAASLSIAHTGRGAIAALGTNEQTEVGVDLVDLEE
ncbi:MAG TPA: hypothetical protein VMF30_15880, partial [Pirellulales bacterium]|nr:hypothetical protein [Pirellulales bacterium]